MITRQALLEKAGAATFERGEAYRAGGRVVALSASDKELNAVVRGARDYTVKLWLKGSAWQHACDCPFASEGALCKHAVAAALAYLAAEAG